MKSPSIRRRQEVRDRLPNFHLWINVCIAGKTVLLSTIPERHGDKLGPCGSSTGVCRSTVYFTLQSTPY